MKVRHTSRSRNVVTTSSSSSSSSSSVSNAPPGRYPDTEDDDLSNPKLDTWIAPFTWKESLIEPKLPAELCKKPEGGGGGANDALSGPVYKHLELRKIRVSDGAAAYYFD
jgi:predicted AAA+ superfamily ATPase